MKKIKIPKKVIRELQRDLPQLGKPFKLLWCDLHDIRTEIQGNPHAWGWISPDLLNHLNKKVLWDKTPLTLIPQAQCEVKMLG